MDRKVITEPGARFPHVAALDGLRGVAVAAVVVYHLWPSALPGGFIGVDVFMVLSGFLLSSLLVQTVALTGGVSFGAFLLARFRRLLPALLLVLLAVTTYAATAMTALEAGRVREHTVASLAYVANWRFVVDGTTYTDVVAGASPLRHLWSLSIEEQFYVALAVSVAVLVRACRGDVRRLRQWLGGGAGVLAVASTVWMAALHLRGADQARVYFGTDTRAQTLLVGVVLGSVLVGRRPAGRLARPFRLGAAIGATALVAVALTARESSGWMYVGGFALVALSGAAVVGGAQVGGLGRLLERRPVVALGAISYGVYLWHWPIIVIADETRTGISGAALPVVQLATTLALATLSYHLVERPVRRGSLGAHVGRPALLAGPLAVAIVASMAVWTTRPSGSTLAVRPSVPAATLPIPAPVPITTPVPATTLPISTPVPPTPAAAAATSPPTDAPRPVSVRRVVMLGDSVAHTLAGGSVGEFPAFTEWTPELSPYDVARIDLVSLAKPACSFLPGDMAVPTVDGSFTGVSFTSFCGDWRAELDAVLATGVDDVVLVPSNDLAGRIVDGELVEIGSAAHDALLLGFVDEVRTAAHGAGARLVLVALPPRVGHAVDPHGDRERYFARLVASYAIVHPHVATVDLGPVVCPDDACLDWRDDGWHYTADGARRVAAVLTATLTS